MVAEEFDYNDYAEPYCPRCKGHHDRHEDAACGCGCGMEPMGCATCDLFCGSSEPYDPYDEPGYDEEWRGDDGEGCNYCEVSDKCDYCPHGENINWATCPAGPRPDRDLPAYEWLVLWLMDKVADNYWAAQNMIWRGRDEVCDSCRKGCENCDYQWQRERLDKGMPVACR